MKVISGIGRLSKPLNNSFLAIGVFDGVHIGHQKLISYIVKKAKKNKVPAVIMTFAPHPVHVLRPDHFLPLIIPLERRLQLFEKLGVDVTLVARFTKTFAKMSPERFIKRYIVNGIQPQEIVVGSDFKFGSGRSGSLDYFQSMGQKYGFNVVPLQCIEGESSKVGSTMIRNFIQEGQLKKAAKYLGRSFTVEGVVKRGYRRGMKLGYPTANIYPENMLLPPDGAYAVKVNVDGKIYNGMANVGFCPSFHNVIVKKSIEVHIFRFHQMIYRKSIKIEFIKYLRPEKKFTSPEALKAQLNQDKESALTILKV